MYIANVFICMYEYTYITYKTLGVNNFKQNVTTVMSLKEAIAPVTIITNVPSNIGILIYLLCIYIYIYIHMYVYTSVYIFIYMYNIIKRANRSCDYHHERAL
jgi:hypothetical protein